MGNDAASDQKHTKIKEGLCPKVLKKKRMKRRNHVDQPKSGISFDNIIYTIHIKVSALLGSKYFNLST